MNSPSQPPQPLAALRLGAAALGALFVITAGAALAQAPGPSIAPAPAASTQETNSPPTVPKVPLPADSSGKPTAVPPTLASMQWLEGCWQGSVNKRDFREVWLPQRGGMMIGVSQTVSGDQTLDYEYLRVEPRTDGVYYVASPPGKPEEAFKLTSELVDVDDAHTFVFLDPARDFPQRIGYRRASEGWLYTEVEGKVKGAERKVIYPMRRVDCETGEFIRK